MRIGAKCAEELDAVHPGHIEVEQHEPPVGRDLAVAEHLQRLDAVLATCRGFDDLVLLERPPDVHHVDRVVLHEEDVEHPTRRSSRDLVARSCFGQRKLNVEPGRVRTRRARGPRGVDDLLDERESDAGSLDLVAGRQGLEDPQILSWNSVAMPGPLSVTKNS